MAAASASTGSGSIGLSATLGRSIVLEERIDPAHPPSDAEVHDYARWLGMDPQGADAELMWIAREGLMAPLPHHWKACQAPGEGGEIYYFNFSTGESQWEHPMDAHYRQLFAAEKQKYKQQGKQQAKQRRRRRSSADDATPQFPLPIARRGTRAGSEAQEDGGGGGKEEEEEGVNPPAIQVEEAAHEVEGAEEDEGDTPQSPLPLSRKPQQQQPQQQVASTPSRSSSAAAAPPTCRAPPLSPRINKTFQLRAERAKQARAHQQATTARATPGAPMIAAPAAAPTTTIGVSGGDGGPNAIIPRSRPTTPDPDTILATSTALTTTTANRRRRSGSLGVSSSSFSPSLSLLYNSPRGHNDATATSTALFNTATVAGATGFYTMMDASSFSQSQSATPHPRQRSVSSSGSGGAGPVLGLLGATTTTPSPATKTKRQLEPHLASTLSPSTHAPPVEGGGDDAMGASRRSLTSTASRRPRRDSGLYASASVAALLKGEEADVADARPAQVQDGTGGALTLRDTRALVLEHEEEEEEKEEEEEEPQQQPLVTAAAEAATARALLGKARANKAQLEVEAASIETALEAAKADGERLRRRFEAAVQAARGDEGVGDVDVDVNVVVVGRVRALEGELQEARMRNEVLAAANRRLAAEQKEKGEDDGDGGSKALQRQLEKARAEVARLQLERDVLLGDQERLRADKAQADKDLRALIKRQQQLHAHLQKTSSPRSPGAGGSPGGLSLPRSPSVLSPLTAFRRAQRQLDGGAAAAAAEEAQKRVQQLEAALRDRDKLLELLKRKMMKDEREDSEEEGSESESGGSNEAAGQGAGLLHLHEGEYSSAEEGELVEEEDGNGDGELVLLQRV